MNKMLMTVAFVTCLATSAHAAATSKDHDNYVGLNGTFGKSAFQAKGSGITAETKKGNDIGGEIAFGHYFTKNVRSELTLGHSALSIKEDGDTLSRKSTSAMANAYYDFKNESVFTPYVMGGVGASYGKFSSQVDGGEKDTATKTSFVWQVGAGVDTKVSDNVKLGLGYRFRDDTASWKNDLVTYKFKPEHMMVASVKYSF